MADPPDPVAAAGAAPQPAAAATGLSANAADVANTTIAGNQFVRSVDALAGGGYAVTWSSAGSLFVQRYDAQGAKAAGETRVAYDATASETPAIAVLRDGTVAVASVRADGAVFVRRFDASGKAALGADTVVALPATFPLAQPVLQSLGDGGFAAGWASNEQDAAGPARAQHVQRFDAQSRPVGAQADFAAAGADRNLALKLVALPGGGFVAGTTHRFDGIPYVQYRIGATIVGALSDANAGMPELNTTLVPLADGRFALWSTASSGGYLQVIDASGHAIGTNSSVNVVPDTAAALADGGWVTVTRQMPGQPGIAQRFDATGRAAGDAVSTAGDFSRPLPVASTSNGLAFAWTFTGAQGDADVRTQSVLTR